MRVILRLLTIFFDAIYDGISDANRAMKEYNEFCKGMRTMSLRQRVKYLEVCNVTNQIAIDALREGLKQALCDEHVPIVDHGVWLDIFNRERDGYRRMVCSKCGKVLVDRLGTEEYLNFKVKESVSSTMDFQDELDKFRANKDEGDE